MMPCRGSFPPGTYGPIFDLLPPKKLAVIVAHETVNACIKAGNEGLQLTRLLLQIGDAVQLEVRCPSIRGEMEERRDGLRVMLSGK